MADYRLSSQIITRSSGKSAVAAAAYRASDNLEDERTGVRHDYSRKSGVVHSEVLAPANTPDWMTDRAKLWNAVEAVEKRKNSQLAREIQLSLPHELTPEQRTELVRDFVQEQFTARGMIADVNIHSPNPKGDERNHHAHIMLTMRELTGDGFHTKKSTPTARGWNDKELLATWREEWARYQNSTLERHGHSERVDHRSFEQRGIDREPQQHLGVAANDMLAKGKSSRIDNQNSAIEMRNAARAMRHAKAAQQAATMSEIFGKVAQQEQKEKEQQRQQDLKRQQARETEKLKEKQKEQREHVITMQAEAIAIKKRLQATGFKKVARNIIGATDKDLKSRHELNNQIAAAKEQMKKEQNALNAAHKEQNRQAVEAEKKQRHEQKQRMSAKVARDFNQARNQPAQQHAAKEEKTQREVEKLVPTLKPKSAQQTVKEAWNGGNPQTVTADKVPVQKTEIAKEWQANKKDISQEQPKPELKPTPTRKPPSL